MSLNEFIKEFNKGEKLYDEVYEVVNEVGGLNLWDSKDMEKFYEIYYESYIVDNFLEK